jgi:cytochrome c553
MRSSNFRRSRRVILPVGALALLYLVGADGSTANGADTGKSFAVPKEVQTVLATYCVDCHGAKGRGNVSLTNLESLKLNDRLDTLNKVQDQLFYKMMPPAAKDQPGAKEAQVLAAWVRAELRQHKASKLDDRLPYPDAGNYVDHAALFDGTNRDKPFTPARRWLVSPQIFEERVLDVFKLEGREREQLKRAGFHGVTNPFVLPDSAGVRYYDLQALDGGHLLVMLTNAEWIAGKQLQAARVKAGDAKATPDDPKDKWSPKTTPAAFEAIIVKKTAPTDDEICAAVQTQFDCVLRRPASEKESQAYVQLTRDAIKLGGNTDGLRQMLKAVLLESEFVYRLEFGEGKADTYGRTPLAPREAAYAIAYALGDRGPDPQLLKAARDGRLTTKADYEREVLRLLADKTYYAGLVDRSLGLKESTTTATHPRLVRFFREFFGYPMAVKVFKDEKRADGHYVNADRGGTKTPGHLVDEADALVDWTLSQDRAVFETLLTTDRYFVYHNVDNEKGARLIAGWKTAYDALKGTDWKKNPDAVAEQYADTIKKYLDPKGMPGTSPNKHANSVTRFMTYFEYTFGHGRTPFTVPPWTFANHYWYSPIYNLPKTPGHEGAYGGDDQLDYHPEQPFALPHRKGILTHPAWLVAFASNTHTDPVRRGRWIREKLLAGVVPDVPITVDAKIPDDAPRTLRERLHSVTQAAACVKCHSRMNPLGYPLEQFDDFGRFRTAELLEHPDNLIKAGKKHEADLYKTKPVDSRGALDGTGDSKLDGPVTDAFDLIDRLGRSERVRQSIIRHAFRFFLGRNELPSDSQTLIDADRAYVKSGGSFKAVVVSLLTSDSFIYRKKLGN